MIQFTFTLAGVNLNPSPSGLPGSNVLQTITNGIGFWGLIISLAALIIGACTWALGAHSQNYNQSVLGKRAVIVSAAAATLIGASPTLVNFFYSLGQQAH